MTEVVRDVEERAPGAIQPEIILLEENRSREKVERFGSDLDTISYIGAAYFSTPDGLLLRKVRYS